MRSTSRLTWGCCVATIVCAVSIARAAPAPPAPAPPAPPGLPAPRAAAEANRLVERSFLSAAAHADPFNQVELDVLFTTPSGVGFRVPAFWAGGKTWRVRYASPEGGTHRFRTICSDPSDSGLHGVEGAIEISRYTGDNPLYRHGPIRVSSNRRHFEHADGTPFFWLGDTWWMGLSRRLRFPGEFAKLAQDRVAKGFTVVQIVAGLYPDMPAFDPRGANETGFPWEAEYARIRPAYFDAADARITYLVDSALAPCVVGAWGYHLPWLGVERMKRHWRYIVARWSAYPVIWCAAGEGAMPYYLEPDKAKHAELQKHGWTEIARYIREIDPFDRPITIHPTDLSRNQVTDASALDFEMLQTGHGDRASIAPTIALVQKSRAAAEHPGPAMPTLNSEVCYEGILDTCRDDVVRIVTWHSLLGGTAGHTYGANGIWQVNRRGEPYGKSPHGGNWGETPWDEAMRLPGSAQVGHAKRLLEQFEWWRFEAHPEWAAWETTSETDGTAPMWGDWVWHAADADAAQNAPAAKRQFRYTFTLPPDARIDRALLHLSADDRFIAQLDGIRLGSSDAGNESWRRPRRFDLKPLLAPGRTHAITVETENVAAHVPQNPAGLIGAGAIVLAGGGRIELATGEAWTSRAAPGDAWRPVRRLAPYGASPWGEFTETGPAVPLAIAGIPGQVRVIYAAEARPIRLKKLDPSLDWQMKWMNPIDGQAAPLPKPQIAADNSSLVDPPAGARDWVLILSRS